MVKRASSNHDYPVGYGRPPKKNQFRPGHSGNPRGRPRGSKNAATVLNQVLAEKVTVNENGRRRRVTKLEAAFKQVVNRAAAGEVTASRLLIQILPMLNGILDEALPASLRTEADLEILQGLLGRLKAADSTHLTDTAPQEEEKP